MNSIKKLAKALGAKTAKPCNNCLTKRARWFCVTDDVFLCQVCDSKTHSSNRSHERIRLNTASLKSQDSKEPLFVASWYQGFVKKPRTPRKRNELVKQEKHPLPVQVPEVDLSETKRDEDSEMKLCMVPSMDKRLKSGSSGCSSEVCDEEVAKERKILLRLDYESVMATWASHGSPWTTGNRPEFDIITGCWQDCMGTCGACGKTIKHIHGSENEKRRGREARVSRYREKRRNRLYAKKIRYEVRKRNAEKRPRIKGRFVKRTI